MAQQVKLRRSSVAGNKPTTSQLELGELAINTNDGKLYFEKSSSLGESIQEIIVTDAWNTGSLKVSGSNTLIGNTSLTGSFLVSGSTTQIGNNTLTGITSLTGSINVSGSQTFVGNQSLTGSFLVSGSTTQVGNNTLAGNTVLSGSIVISGSVAPGNLSASVNIYGDTAMTGFLRFNPYNTNIDTSISASYIYVSGSTNDLYFSQNGGGYSNTTRLRWLEGNLYTGLLNGGVISASSATTYTVSSGSGIIVSLNGSLSDNPYPTIKYLNWGTLSASIAPLTASYDQQFIGIDDLGAIYAQGTPFYNGQYDTLIPVGIVLHQNRSTINAVKTQPSVAYGYKQRTNVFTQAFGPLKLSGLTLAVSGSSTGSLIVGSGTAFLDGANYTTDPNNPSYVTDTGTSISKIFRYRQSGSNWVYDTNGGAGYGAIDPTQYSNNGVLTAVPGTGANREFSIQRVFWFPNSVTKAIVVYYGNATYLTKVDALANVSYESFVEAPNTAANAIYIGAIIVRNDATFTDAATFTIQPGGLFRQVGGSGGGGSVVTQTLAGLSDVSITGPTDHQPLAYNTTAAKWTNQSTITASIIGNATTATSASYAATASYIINAISASYANNATTASYALTATSASYANNTTSASYALNATTAATASYANNFTVAGTLTAQTLVVQTISSSVIYSSGSNVFGNNLANTQVFTGSMYQTGSVAVFLSNVAIGTTSPSYTLDVNGTGRFGAALTINGTSVASTVLTLQESAALPAALAIRNRNSNQTWGLAVDTATVDDKNFGVYNITNASFPFIINATTSAATFSAGVTATSFTGSLLGTASYAIQALSASYYGGSITSASYANNATSASYALTATSASYATNALSASYYGGTIASASYATNALSASYVNTLNQNVLITGSLTVGATSAGATESTLTLGPAPAGGAGEGGQLGLNAVGGTYASASFIDNWQNNIRILKGTNAGSSALVAQWNLHTTQMTLPAYTSATSFVGTATANLAVDSSGNVITVSTSGGSVFPYTGNAVITGSLTTTQAIYSQANGAMYFRGGDDAEFWDINVANTVGIYGQQDATVGSIKLGSGGGTISGKSGRVGIGTTNPVNGTLEVSGNVYATSFTGSFSGSISAPGSTTQIVYNSGGALAADSGLVYSGSRVGIGTATPANNLHIYGTGDQIIKIENSGTYLMYLGLVSNEGYIGSTNATPLTFYTNNVNRMYITTGGNVGIGTTSPSEKLSVYGNIKIDSNNEASLLKVYDSGVFLGAVGKGNYAVSGADYTGISMGSQGAMSFASGGTTERMRITSAGKVGIGTTNPTQYSSLFPAQLAVNASSTVDGIFSTTDNSSAAELVLFKKNPSNDFGSLLIQHSGSVGRAIELNYGVNMSTGIGGTTSYFVNTNGSGYYAGNVGIGTTNPSAKLEILGSDDQIILNTAGTYSSIYFRNNGTNVGQLFSTNAATYLTTIGSRILYLGGGNAVSQMTLDGTNVGINTSSPAAKLDIKGDLIVSSSLIINQNTASLASGAQTISTNATSSYTAVFYNYTVASGSNARAGQVSAVWNGGSIQYTDVSTTDIGSTSGVAFTASLNGANVRLTTVLPTSGWTVKTLANLL